MRGPTCYADLPRSALNAMRGDEGCFTLMQALWHEAGGAWGAATRCDRNELAQMIEEFDLDDDGGSLVDRYANLCSSMAHRSASPGQRVARIRRAHGLHQLLLAYHFRGQGIEAASHLASVAVSGFGVAESVGELMCLSEPTVMHIAERLSTADPHRLLEALPRLIGSVLETAWGRSLGRDTREHSCALARDRGFRHEFEDLLALYARAAALRHLVLIG